MEISKTHLTIGGKYLGLFLKIEPDANGDRYMHGVIWFPRSLRRLGYLYPSIRIG